MRKVDDGRMEVTEQRSIKIKYIHITVLFGTWRR